MKRFMKAIFNLFALFLGGDCEARRNAVDLGLCDFGGQGHDKYGK